MPNIHATAVISPEAELADDVAIGPFAVLQGKIRLGPGCVVGPQVVLIGELTVGARNRFHTGCVIGDDPQHNGYDGSLSAAVIGSGNVFREGVTVHRGMPRTGRTTTIGDRNLFMANAHIAHDCVVGSDVVLANGALVGGHCDIEDRVFLSGNIAVHQFCRVGKMGMVGGTSCISQDLPPFWIVQGRINELHGVNIVGMRRAGMSRDEITAIRFAYKLFVRKRLPIPDAIAELREIYGTLDAVKHFIGFVEKTKRGICSRHQGSKAVNDADGDTDNGDEEQGEE